MKKWITGCLAVLVSCAVASAQSSLNPAWDVVTGATNSDYVTDIWVNPDGDTYMVGNIGNLSGSTLSDGIMLAKFNAHGAEKWRIYVHGNTTDWDLMAKGICGDEEGNIYISYNERFRYIDSSINRVVMHKYDSTGNAIWEKYITPRTNGMVEELATNYMFEKNGFVYISGNTYDNVLQPQSDMNALVYKIDAANGDVAAHIRYDATLGSDEMFKEVRVADDGTIWAVGRSKGMAGPGGIYSDYDAVVVQFDASGNLQWEHRINGSANGVDLGINICVDDAGNTYLSSQLKKLGISQREIMVRKIDMQGNEVWSEAFMGSSSEYLYKQPIELLPNGNVLLVYSNENGINLKAFDAITGNEAWYTTYSRHNTGSSDFQRDLMLDAQGNIYITGKTRDTTSYGNGHDMTTLKFSMQGNLEWFGHYNLGNYNTSGDQGVTLGLDRYNNVYVAGWGQGANYNNEFILVKYGMGGLGFSEETNRTISVYPNPSSEWFSIVAENWNLGNVELIDLTGKQQKTWYNSDGKELYIGDLPSGIYVITISQPNQRVYTSKLIVTR